MKLLADLSPEVLAIVGPIIGFIAKWTFDALINLFKNTITTPARVAKLEEDIKAVYGRIGDIDKNIATSWSKYEDVKERLVRIEDQQNS